jgi:hypothetical protein
MIELGTFHAVVRALINNGHLPSRRTVHPVICRPISLVAQADLDAFRRTYVPLSELARKRRKHPRSVRVELERKGVHPAPELDKETYRVVFYRRAEVENVM